MIKAKICSFTLIEILVAVTIIILFAGYAAINYSGYNETKKLEKETAKLVDLVEQARKKTLTGDASMCNSTSSQVENYSVDFPNPTQYQLSPNCLTGTPMPQSYSLDTNLQFLTPYPTIEFQPLSRGANNACIKLQNTSSTECRCIEVDNSGGINDCTCVCTAACNCP